MIKIVGRVLAVLLLLVAGLFWLAFFSPRPPLMTDPATLAGDGTALNYCELPVLDGSGKRAADIPKGNTPACNYGRFPLPILAECTEPLVEGAEDMRGLWIGVGGKHIGHVERVEQCGNRMVVTTAGIIHDFRMDGTLKNGARDIQNYCTNFASAIKVDKHGKVIFRLFDLFDTVSRHLDGENMVFTFVDGTETRMSRTCYLPEDGSGMYQAGF